MRRGKDRTQRNGRVSTAWQKRWVVVGTLAIVAGAGLVVRAVHDTGAFEMDGNAVSANAAGAGVPDDWDHVFASTSNATATSFTQDVLASGSGAGTPSLAATIFTGGGSKDPSDINSWAWKDDANGPPDKDNLLHSFAARYSLPPTNPADVLAGTDNGKICFNGTGDINLNGVKDPGEVDFVSSLKCEVLYFGSDRYDNSGDATQAFWFFQNAVGLGTNPLNGGTGFTGSHKAGDLLVISDFSNGGTTSTIVVLKWDPKRQLQNGTWVGCTATGKAVKSNDPTKTVTDLDCAETNLRKLGGSTNANCANQTDGDAFCGIVNPANGPLPGGLSDAPWPTFLDKSGNTDFLNGEFYEGGVNLSLLGLAGECFASVASETRSSTSPTAVLKDFVLGSFARCESGISTTPQTLTGTPEVGTDISANVSIGTGIVKVRDKAVVNISGVQAWTGTIDFSLCGPADLAPTAGKPATCSAGGVLIGDDQPISDGANPTTIFSPPAYITSVGRYCWRADFTSSTPGVPNASDSAVTECFNVVPVAPGLITSATTTVALGQAISDSATLSTTASQPTGAVIHTSPPAPAAAGGTIVFRLYGPSDTNTCTDPATGVPGNLVYTSPPQTVSGDGVYGPVSFTPTVAGSYRWIATYSGNPPNTVGSGPNGSISGSCADTTEKSIVTPLQPGISTNATGANGLPLGSSISDSATLTGAAANAGGSITFKAYGPNDATCTGAVAFTSAAIPVNGNGTYNSGSFTPTAVGTYRWIASYSGDLPNTLAVSGACTDANEASLIIETKVATSQFFYPNDSATITATAGSNLAGTIRFRVYTGSTCAANTLVYDSGLLDATTAAGVLTKTVETTNTANRVSGNVSVYWIVDFDSTNAQHADVSLTCGTERATIAVTDKQ